MNDDQTPKRISGSYQIPIPRDELLALLSEAHGPYSMARARLSLALDRDAGTEKSLREYARLWGWTKRKVEYNIGELRATVEHWETARSERRRTEPRPSFKDHAKGTATGQLRDSEGDKNTANLPRNGEVGDTLRDGYGTGHGTHTKQSTIPEEEIQGVGVPRARRASDRGTSDESPRNPANGFPQEEEVVEFAMAHGSPDQETAKDVYWSMMANGWKGKNGEMYPDWGHAVINALRYRKTKNGNAAHQPNAKPPSDFERRRRGVDQSTVDANLERIRRGDFGFAARDVSAGSDPDTAGRTPV